METNGTSDGNVTSVCCYRNESSPVTPCLGALLPPSHVLCPRNVTCYCFVFPNAVNATESFIAMCRAYFDLLLKAENDAVVTKTNTYDLTVTTEFGSDLYYIIPMCISLPFLIATFVIYTVIPELKNVHGFVLRTYLLCCTWMFIAITAVFFIRPLFCIPAIGISTHFAILAKFFWLNVMSFDIWWTFRSMTNKRKQSSRKKKIIYFLYAWGMASLIVAIAIITEFVPNLPEGVIKPGLAIAGCWLGTFYGQLVYVGIPIGLTLLSNVGFFSSAAITIFRQKSAAAQQLGGVDSKRHNEEKYRFYVYLKLFLLTGLMWIADLTWLVWNDTSGITSYIINLPHLLQGPIIFKVFVWNDRIKRLLSARLGLQDKSFREWIGLKTIRTREPTQATTQATAQQRV